MGDKKTDNCQPVLKCNCECATKLLEEATDPCIKVTEDVCKYVLPRQKNTKNDFLPTGPFIPCTSYNVEYTPKSPCKPNPNGFRKNECTPNDEAKLTARGKLLDSPPLKEPIQTTYNCEFLAKPHNCLTAELCRQNEGQLTYGEKFYMLARQKAEAKAGSKKDHPKGCETVCQCTCKVKPAVQIKCPSEKKDPCQPKAVIKATCPSKPACCIVKNPCATKSPCCVVKNPCAPKSPCDPKPACCISKNPCPPKSPCVVKNSCPPKPCPDSTWICREKLPCTENRVMKCVASPRVDSNAMKKGCCPERLELSCVDQTKKRCPSPCFREAKIDCNFNCQADKKEPDCPKKCIDIPTTDA